jgi:hypothetical protein
MNTNGCPGGFFSDELYEIESGCRQSRTAWIVFAVFVGLLNLFDVAMISHIWFRAYCTRRAYSKSSRQDFCCNTRLPVVPILRLAFLILNLVFILLASLDVISFRDGSSVAMGFISLIPLFLYHYLSARQYLRLGKKSIPLAKRLMSTSMSAQDSSSPAPPSPRNLVRTPSLLSFRAKDVSRLSPISMSVLSRFYLWTGATIARLIVGIFFAPAFPREPYIVTAAYACQLAADIGITFMISQLGNSIKALNEILKTSSSSGATLPGSKSNFRWYLLTSQYLIMVQLGLTMCIHALLVAGFRDWFVVFLEPVSLSIFHVLHTVAVYNNAFRARKRCRDNAGHAPPVENANAVVVNNPQFKLDRIQLDKPATVAQGDDCAAVRIQPRSNVKGVRSETPGNATGEGASQEPNF